MLRLRLRRGVRPLDVQGNYEPVSPVERLANTSVIFTSYDVYSNASIFFATELDGRTKK
ncbi:MAG: hypothetical protein M0Z92_02970 [Actinomycetota bacterium]|nr:hypothetical protein [Actinomycetota bacterium]